MGVSLRHPVNTLGPVVTVVCDGTDASILERVKDSYQYFIIVSRIWTIKNKVQSER